ncbi:hypothetical protein JAAARDRAFT_209051 [Jaapia argillacea MUCL 33604]|uniref:Las1-domain-containing protein n=1 Tax=Jaapia argillacea MUCL 33604 TaxID=933084 RepID=A0A067PWY0_9AGAM|nr:hypothetical protein JAAARDRAFT_209051 [Jaapia argillacea MUCL 33604]
MRLPRRVPWTSITELEQVCSWIYSDENDLAQLGSAARRLSAWRVSTVLPHALESALAILVVILQDKKQENRSSLSLRQSYATAIIRLVNGLVDPLQRGVYARSIASIATQLGLPAWLVELRHAATHEDLPSLEVLREAARESMSWLLQNYFLPTLNPASTPTSQLAPLSPLAPFLKSYKSLAKLLSRDATLKYRYKHEFAKTLRDIERWISEAKVAADGAMGEFGWGAPGNVEETATDAGEEDVRERWAMERLCDALLQKGGLVPVSKKKRVASDDSGLPPVSSINIWRPLLDHLRTFHPSLLSVLASRIVLFLTTDTPLDGEPNGLPSSDLSHGMVLARWMVWLVQTYASNDESDAELRREDMLAQLITSVGPGLSRHMEHQKAIEMLLHSLSVGSPNIDVMMELVASDSIGKPSGDWQQDDIDVMTQRLNSLIGAAPLEATRASEAAAPSLTSTPAKLQFTLPNGWKAVDDSSIWKPCPIGVFIAL